MMCKVTRQWFNNQNMSCATNSRFTYHANINYLCQMGYEGQLRYLVTIVNHGRNLKLFI